MIKRIESIVLLCLERLATARGKTLVSVGLVAGFVAYRWAMRVEPLNSDDLTLFSISASAVEGEHWLFAGEPPSASHHSLRLGLLPLLVPAISWLGANHLAFYAAPIAVATLGFWICWRTMLKEVGVSLALVFALCHVALPFEVMRASLPLVDLPSAVFVMLALFSVDRLARKAPESLVQAGWRGAIAGLAGFEAYLLRTNSVVLLTPGLLTLLVVRRTRSIALFAGITLALGIGFEQVLYMSMGTAPGYRWQMIQNAVGGYSPFLPVIDPEDFLVRYFVFAYRQFGHGSYGVLMCGFLVVSLGTHIVALIRSNALTRALAATGLVTFVVFAYGMFAWDERGIHALAPTNFRYLQLFYYTSIVILAWGAGCLWSRVTQSRAPMWTRALFVLGMMAVAILPYDISRRFVGPRVSSREGVVQRVTCALDDAANRASEKLVVYTTAYSSRVIRLFRGPWSEPPVEWRFAASVDELPELANRGVPFLFFDHRRLRLSARYRSGEAFERYTSNLNLLDERLAQSYELLSGQEKGALYQRGSVELASLRDGLHWYSNVGRSLERSDSGFTMVAPRSKERFYLFTGESGDWHGAPIDDPQAALPPAWVHMLRFRLDYPETVKTRGWLMQYADRELLDEEKLYLGRSWNTVHFDSGPGATSFRLLLEIRNLDPETPAEISVGNTEIRSWPDRAGCIGDR